MWRYHALYFYQRRWGLGSGPRGRRGQQELLGSHRQELRPPPNYSRRPRSLAPRSYESGGRMFETLFNLCAPGCCVGTAALLALLEECCSLPPLRSTLPPTTTTLSAHHDPSPHASAPPTASWIWVMFVFSFFTAVVLAGKQAYTAASVRGRTARRERPFEALDGCCRSKGRRCWLTPLLAAPAQVMVVTQVPAIFVYRQKVLLGMGHYARTLPLQATLAQPTAHVDPGMYCPPPLRSHAAGWYPEWGKVGAAG